MHQILFVAAADSVVDLDPEESPANSFPCMSSQQFHRDTRSQLYALVGGLFLDEAAESEQLDQALLEDGPYIYKLTHSMTAQMAVLEEDDVESLAARWIECEELEQLEVTTSDLHEFLFQFIHFCQIAINDDLNLYIYSDD